MTIPIYASGLLFTQAHKAVRSAIYNILDGHDINASQWAILGATLQAPDGIRLTTVAKQMDVKAPLVTMLSTDLVQMGLIIRIHHHTDGRAKLLVVTAKGKKVALKIESEINEKIGTLLNGASDDEILAFQNVLEIILHNA